MKIQGELNVFAKKNSSNHAYFYPFEKTFFKLLKFLGLTNTVEWTLVKKKETVTLHLKQIGNKIIKETQ